MASPLRELAPFAPILAALIVAWRTRRLIHAVVNSAAVTPESALPIDRLGIRDSGTFRRLIRRRVIVVAGADRYYLDEARYREWRAGRRKAVMFLAAGLLALAAIGFAIGWLRI